MIVQNMRSLDIAYPAVDPEEKARFEEMRQILDGGIN